jgi:hypothetical protein
MLNAASLSANCFPLRERVAAARDFMRFPQLFLAAWQHGADSFAGAP